MCDVITLFVPLSCSVESLKMEAIALSGEMKRFLDTLQRGSTASRLTHEARLEVIRASPRTCASS